MAGFNIQGAVGVQNAPDGSTPLAKLGNQAEVMTNSMNGDFYEQVLRGNGYVFNTALAGNALVAATTSNAPAILNPAGSGKLLVVQKITFVRTAVGTPLEGGIVHLRTQNVTSAIGTGAQIVSGTAVAAVNLRSDKGDNSGMIFYPTTIVTTPTPSVWAQTGISQIASTGTTTGVGTFTAWTDLNGLLVVAPGTLYSLGASVSLSTTYAISIFGFVVNLPTGL